MRDESETKLVRQTISEQRKLHTAYRALRGLRTERIIWPIALRFFESRRIMLAGVSCEMIFVPFQLIG